MRSRDLLKECQLTLLSKAPRLLDFREHKSVPQVNASLLDITSYHTPKHTTYILYRSTYNVLN